MITKTLNLDSAYQELFADVLAASTAAHAIDSSKPIIDVDNLDAFYGSIEEIAALDPKFLRLPLDEPLFEIDANTRKITVPAEFKTNGVSVQKDHLAEVIFFRIERYFDYTDLSTCDIVINWKMGSKEGKTTRFIKFEKVFTIDETKASCIVFGWPINDIVTEKSGALTFAVEFFKTEGTGDDKKVIYRFNTLPVSVNIKDGLVISDDAQVYELDADIMRTLVNSSFGEGTAAVGDIIWLTGNGNGLVVGEGVGTNVILQDYVPTINLNTTIVGGVPSSDVVNLYAEGYVDEGTKIRYVDPNNTTAQLSTEMLKVVRPRVQVEYDAESDLVYYASAIAEEPLSAQAAAEAEELWIDGALDPTLKYYVEESENAFVEAEEEDLAKWGKADAVELFVEVAKVQATTAGTYIIKAQGYKVGNDGNKIGNGDVKSTASVVVPAVVAPSVIDVSVSELTSVDTGYSFNEEQTANVMFLNAEDQGIISASAVVDSFGALQFTWQKKVGEDTSFSNVAEGDVAFQDTNSSELEVAAPGNYKVSVVNYLNGGYSTAVESVVITASRIAGKITSVTPKWAVGQANPNATKINVATRQPTYNSNSSSMNSHSLTLYLEDVVIQDGGQQGTLEYAWYTPVYEDVDDIPTIVGKAPIAGATSASFTVSGGDKEVIPEVRNNCNGSIYTYTLDPIAVNDSAT